MNKTTMSVETTEKAQCQGACEKHAGEVRMVFVQGWGEWMYCEEAIAEDKRRGLVVTETKEQL